MSEIVLKNILLPSGQLVTLKELKGLHLFNALSYSKGDMGLMIKSIVQQSTFINGNQIEFRDLEEMSIADLSLLNKLVISMLNGENPLTNFYGNI